MHRMNSLNTLNIAAYRFIKLENLEERQASLLDLTNSLALKGSILLSVEGINLMLAGTQENITVFKKRLCEDQSFENLIFKESLSTQIPFEKIKVKIKSFLIPLRGITADFSKEAAPRISPKEFKQWLDEKRDITILDARNDFEIEYGSFENALNLDLKHFNDFPKAAQQQLDDNQNLKEKLLVMFCTGGIRCEKASVVMQRMGFQKVYQLDGGILNYFAKCSHDHFQGKCYVFDKRIVLNEKLQ